MTYQDRWIVMGRDECNDEFRPSDKTWTDQNAANEELSNLRVMYPEARSMWVELLKDKAYFQSLRESHEDYWDEEYDPDFY